MRSMMHQKELPPLTPALAARMEQCDIDYFAARLEALRNNTMNPFGVTIRQYGAATALMTLGTKNSLFNRVGGISRKESEYIDTIIDWYRENKVRWAVCQVLCKFSESGCFGDAAGIVSLWNFKLRMTA